jgi:hypothetical protein
MSCLRPWIGKIQINPLPSVKYLSDR